jgi:ribonuclease P protein component
MLSAGWKRKNYIEMPHPHAFPATRRLSGNLRFAAVFDAKVKHSSGPLIAYSLPNDLNHWRLGLSVSRRIGTAVRRNRIKRMLREAFRLHTQAIPAGYDLVIVVRAHESRKLADYKQWIANLMRQSDEAWQKRQSQS